MRTTPFDFRILRLCAVLTLGACLRGERGEPSDLGSTERPLGLSSVFGINIDIDNPGGNPTPQVLADASAARFRPNIWRARSRGFAGRWPERSPGRSGSVGRMRWSLRLESSTARAG